MRHKWTTTLLLLLSTLLLTGCWDVKTIQDVQYITAIGVDYKDGKYELYTQVLDFSSVAKQEGGKPQTPAPIPVGHTTGRNMGEAFKNLYRSAQQLVFWGHVSAIVIGENLLDHGLTKEDFDTMIRFREMRYTPWLYGTKEPIEQIFTTKPLFHLSPQASILHQPEQSYQQSSWFVPLTFQNFIADFREPGMTSMLPSLAISHTDWKQNDKPDPKLIVNGIYALRNNQKQGWFDHKSMAGLRWLEKETLHTPLIITVDSEAVATLTCHKPKSHIQLSMDGGNPLYTIEVQMNASITEIMDPQISMTKMNELATQVIQKEIESTFQVGKKSKADLYKLEHILYKRDFKAWSQITDFGQKPADPISLKEVKVKLQLDNSGMYKAREEDDRY